MVLTIERFPVNVEATAKPGRVFQLELLANECDTTVTLIHARDRLRLSVPLSHDSERPLTSREAIVRRPAPQSLACR
jgi:hypothetical protein